MAKATTISAKLAQIVTPTQLAFNAGTEKGVTKGDSVTLYKYVDVTDPDSGDILGTVRVPRLYLKVSFAEEKFCVADVTDTVSDSPYAILAMGRSVKKVSTTPAINHSDAGEVVVVNIGEEAVIRHTEQ